MRSSGQINNGTLEALDGLPITERTGKSRVRGSFTLHPIEDFVFVFIYDKDEDTESPGVTMYPELINKISDNEMEFLDFHKRKFRLSF